MYCNKCGKEIESGNLCAECAAPKVTVNEVKEEYFFADEYVKIPSDSNNRMYGFGKALTSTILSFFGFIFAYVALICSTWASETALVFVFLALPLLIIPIVFGGVSIKAFVSRKNSGCVKPVPTLVLGIVGLSIGCFSMIFEIIAFFIAAALV